MPESVVVENQPRVLVARQAIFDHRMQVFGYELLYRDGSSNAAQFTDGEQASARVMVNSLLEMGIDHIAGKSFAFINLTKDCFLSQYFEVLPSEQAVLEVLESIDPTPEVMEALKRAKLLGYRIALDDFVLKDSCREFLTVADLVKVDVLALSIEELSHHVKILKQYPVQLLAEKVEDQDMYERCCDLGFELFQGYFFCKPQILDGGKLSGNRMAMVLLLAKLQDPDIQMEELEDLIKNDLSLSVKLLRYVNSAAVGLARTIESLSQAVCLVGTERMRQLASLLVLANNTGKPSELMVVALTRAKMCEGISNLKGQNPSQGFTVGLFSVLDAYFDCSMETLLEDLPLAEGLREALLGRTGLLGNILQKVVDFEGGHWEEGPDSTEIHIYHKIYWESLDWAKEVLETVQG